MSSRASSRGRDRTYFLAGRRPRQPDPPPGEYTPVVSRLPITPIKCKHWTSVLTRLPPLFMTEHILHVETRRLFVGAQKLAQGLKLSVPSPTLPQTKLSAPPRAASLRFQRGSAVCQPHPATCDGTLCQVGRRRVATNQPVSLDSSALCAPRQLPWPPPLCLATSLQRSP